MATQTPTIRTQIAVAKCDECPFFERTVINFLVEALAKKAQPARGGTCRFNGLGQTFPVGRLPVSDATTIPEACPLRSGDVFIQLRRPA